MDFDRLVLRNLSRTDRLFHSYVRSECDKIGINASFQGIIRVLSRENGLSQQELAERLVLSKPTISLTLQKMEYEGLIERKPDEADARITRVYLTDQGKEVNEKIINIFKKVEGRIEAVLSEEKQNEFLEMLNLISTELIKIKEEQND